MNIGGETMDIDQLKYFVSVVKYNSFTLASEQLCISQSSLSKHIKAMENKLGISLLDRSTRNVRLTSGGQDFFAFSKEVIESFIIVNSKLQKYKQNEKGHLILGTIPIMSQYGITSLIGSFNKQHPEIEIEIIERKGEEIIELLDASKIDLALVRTITLSSNKYKVLPLIDDEMVIVVHKDHPFVKRKSISLSEASNEKFIFLDAGRGLYDLFINSCHEAGFTPNVLYTNTRVETIIGLVREKVGVSLLMNKVMNLFDKSEISIIKIDENISSTLALVFPHGNKLSASSMVLKNYTVKWFNYKKGKVDL